MPAISASTRKANQSASLDRHAIIEALYVAPAAGAPMEERRSAQLVAGCGIEGDRYYLEPGHSAGSAGRGGDVTLIAAEVIDHLRRDGLLRSAADTRRNLVTRGLALELMLGRRLQIGEAILEPTGVCEPCAALAVAAGDRRLLRALVHAGGLRAKIVRGGTVRASDAVALVADGG